MTNNHRSSLCAALFGALAFSSPAQAAETLPDCASALTSGGTTLTGGDVIIPLNVRAPLAAAMLSPMFQTVAKQTADAWDAEPVTATDIANPPSSLGRLLAKFRATLSAQLSQMMLSRTPIDGTLSLDVLKGWIPALDARRLLSCFPDLVVAGRKLGPRVEAARKVATQQREEFAAMAKLPVNVLGAAYVDYIDVARCYNARRGYLVIHINDFEMDRAKDAVKQIEKALLPSLEGKTSDQLWEMATQAQKNSMIGKLTDNFLADTQAEQICKVSYHRLMNKFQEIVPNVNRIEKP